MNFILHRFGKHRFMAFGPLREVVVTESDERMHVTEIDAIISFTAKWLNSTIGPYLTSWDVHRTPHDDRITWCFVQPTHADLFAQEFHRLMVWYKLVKE